MTHFVDCFKLEMETPEYFTIAEKANEKGAYLIKHVGPING